MSGTAVLPDEILLGDLRFEVRLSHRATVGITVDRDGSLLLHAPIDCHAEALAWWAYSKRRWIYRKLAEKDVLLSARPAKEFVTGEGFAYLGRSHRLKVTEVPTVKLERGRLLLPRSTATSGDAGAVLMRWYRTRGGDWLSSRLKPWVNRMDLHPTGLDIRDLGYRWGSLSRNGRLNIHWATMQLPPSLIDYVLVHELAHMKYERHTPRFWAIVERAMSDFEQRKSALATTGATLWLG